jgi:hypothetical protein
MPTGAQSGQGARLTVERTIGEPCVVRHSKCGWRSQIRAVIDRDEFFVPLNNGKTKQAFVPVHFGLLPLGK